MERRPTEKHCDNGDEIAAALAAVYACLQIEEESPAEGAAGTACKSLQNNWMSAARLEGMNSTAPRFVCAAQAGGNFPTWRNSIARKWTTLSVLLVAFSFIQFVPAYGLERIQFDPTAPAKQTGSGTPPVVTSQPCVRSTFSSGTGMNVVPAPAKTIQDIGRPDASGTPALPGRKSPLAAASAVPPNVQPMPASSLPAGTNQAMAPISTPAPRSIRIALNTATPTAEITCPDGASLYDEKSNKLLAVLPPQSFWQIDVESNEVGRRLAFIGKLGNAAAARVLVAASARTYEPAAYVRKFTSNNLHGFTRPPYSLSTNNPRFFLPIKSEQSLLPTAKQESTFRPVAYQTGPAVQQSPPANPVIPRVVPGYLIVPSGKDGVISYAGRLYRGSLNLKPRTDEQPSFLVINLVELEDYLLSVVPSEMPSNWNPEALKAQSIAARSYALSNSGKHESEGYDLKSTTEDQVYLGVQTESDNSNRAVSDTRGQVLKHNGKVVTAYFHSAGGGYTEQPEHVWGGKVPYLKSVPDFDDQSPHFKWNRSIPVANIEEALKKQGRDIGGLLGIFPLERSPSQRVTTAMLAGTLQTLMVSGEELRKILGLPSTIFNIGAGLDSYLVAGRGFGHGLGMSQWGAKFLAEQGYNAGQILSYYYKDVSVDQQ